MTRVDVLHASGLALVVASSLAIATQSARSPVPTVPAASRGERGEGVSLEGGAAPGTPSTGLRTQPPEGGQTQAPRVAPARIASATLVADGILAEIADPSRVVATTDWLDGGHPLGFRLAGKPRITVTGPVEPVLALRPDLLFVSDLRDAARVRRFEEAGVRVVDLGPVGGLAALDRAIETIATEVGAPGRGAALRARLQTRADALRARPDARPDALYLSAVGDTAWGGAAGTSYHDVLELAGFRDVAAAAGLTGWPQLSAEQLQTLDPPHLVGTTGVRVSVCGRSALARLRACGPGGHVHELPDRVVSDPGPGLLDAAEALAELRAVAEDAPGTGSR